LIEDWDELRQKAVRHDQSLCAAIHQQVPIISRPQGGIDRHGNNPSPDAAEEGSWEIDRILKAQQNALLRLNSEAPERACETLYPLGELAVRAGAVIINVGGLGCATSAPIAFQQVESRVVLARNADRGR